MRLFLLFFVAVTTASASNVTDYFHLHVNLFRSDPRRYQAEFGQQVACDAAPTGLLSRAACLEESAAYQSRSVARASCPVSHQTCPEDCGRFGGCGYTERLAHFCPGATAAAEVLSRGPRRVRRILDFFLRSPGHCADLSEPSVDSIGANFTGIDRNVFVADIALLNRTSPPAFLTAWCDPEARSCLASTTLSHETGLWAWSSTENRTLALPWFAPGFFRAENISREAGEVWFTTLNGSHTSSRYPIA